MSSVLSAAAGVPPGRVVFADPGVRRLVASQPVGDLLLGLGADGEPVSVSLEDAGHVHVASTASAGASSTLRALAAQAVRQGAAVSVVAIRRRSQQWARRLAQVQLWSDAFEIHEGLLWLGELCSTRHGSDVFDVPHRVLVVEDLMSTVDLLQSWWRSQREGGSPRKSPAVTALEQLLITGRAARMSVLASAPVLPPGPRAQFRDSVLMRPTTQMAAAAAPPVSLPEEMGWPRGRALLATGDQAVAAQVVWFTDTEARSWAAGELEGDR